MIGASINYYDHLRIFLLARIAQYSLCVSFPVLHPFLQLHLYALRSLLLRKPIFTSIEICNYWEQDLYSPLISFHVSKTILEKKNIILLTKVSLLYSLQRLPYFFKLACYHLGVLIIETYIKHFEVKLAILVWNSSTNDCAETTSALM